MEAGKGVRHWHKTNKYYANYEETFAKCHFCGTKENLTGFKKGKSVIFICSNCSLSKENHILQLFGKDGLCKNHPQLFWQALRTLV